MASQSSTRPGKINLSARRCEGGGDSLIGHRTVELWLPAFPNQKNHTGQKLFAHNGLTVILTMLPIQTDSFACEGHKKECHDTDVFVLTIEQKMPSDSK